MMMVKAIAVTLALIGQYGTVTEQTTEGGRWENDYYIVELEDGEKHEIEADDLEIGDEVTVYFLAGEPVYTRYGHK